VFINVFNVMLSAWICEALFFLAFQFNENFNLEGLLSLIIYLFTSYFHNRP
jgi:hypothetical protein